MTTMRGKRDTRSGGLPSLELQVVATAPAESVVREVRAQLLRRGKAVVDGHKVNDRKVDGIEPARCDTDATSANGATCAMQQTDNKHATQQADRPPTNSRRNATANEWDRKLS